jgi:hypothetical protein
MVGNSTRGVPIALKNLLQDKVRFVLTIGGISFAEMLILVILGAYAGFAQGAVDLIDHLRQHIFVLPEKVNKEEGELL